MSEIKVNSVVNSTGDNDSGLDLSTNDQVIIKTANTTAVTVDSSQGVACSADLTVDTSTLKVDSSNNRVGIGTASPSHILHTSGTGQTAKFESSNNAYQVELNYSNSTSRAFIGSFSNGIVFAPSSASEAMRIDSSGNVLFSTTGSPDSVANANNTGTVGMAYEANGFLGIARAGTPLIVNRVDSDGSLVVFKQEGTEEGSISVSGSTTSYNGGHLSRYSRLTNDEQDTSIVKGTVMTNLDEMVEWSHEEVLWTDEDELPDGVSVGDVKKSAYIEDNEQLNKMAVSSVEGDVNVAGVFVNWDNDDDFNDMNVAMTGDMVIRIAQGTTVARGDLLMSAGDGTAKPQGDDIVRSKTIAKVISTNVSHTYDDGTYLVPCVLMAC